MKLIIKNILRFFKSFKKLLTIENNIKNDLTYQFREYQKNKDNSVLSSLIHLVDFCKRNGINGDTESIQNKIILEWEKFNKK